MPDLDYAKVSSVTIYDGEGRVVVVVTAEEFRKAHPKGENKQGEW